MSKIARPTHVYGIALADATEEILEAMALVCAEAERVAQAKPRATPRQIMLDPDKPELREAMEFLAAAGADFAEIAVLIGTRYAPSTIFEKAIDTPALRSAPLFAALYRTLKCSRPRPFYSGTFGSK